MKNNMVKWLQKNMLAFSMAACILAMGPKAAYAASVVGTDTISGTAGLESIEPEEVQEEFIDTTSDEDTIFELGEVSENARSTEKSFDWSIVGNALKYTSAFWTTKSQKIQVSAWVMPTNKTVYIGIVEPDNTKRFVYATNSVSYTFSLTQTGYYKVYVRNAGSTTALVNGTYKVVE